MSRAFGAMVAVLVFCAAMWGMTALPRVAMDDRSDSGLWPFKKSVMNLVNSPIDRATVSRCLVGRGLATRELPRGRLAVSFLGGNATVLRFAPTAAAAQAESTPRGDEDSYPSFRNVVFSPHLVREISREQSRVLWGCAGAEW
jgi:hypothetical protein